MSENDVEGQRKQAQGRALFSREEMNLSSYKVEEPQPYPQPNPEPEPMPEPEPNPQPEPQPEKTISLLILSSF
jgi:hypothetical protein